MDTITRLLDKIKIEENARKTLTNAWTLDSKESKIGVRKRMFLVMFPAAFLILSVFCLTLIDVINRKNHNFAEIMIDNLLKKMIISLESSKYNTSEVFSIQEIVKNSRMDFDGGIVIIDENYKIIACSKSDPSKLQISDATFKAAYSTERGKLFRFYHNGIKMQGKTAQHDENIILCYINLETLELQSFKSISHILFLAISMITIMIAVLLFFIVRLTIRPIEKLQKIIKNLNAEEYLDLSRFSDNREISILALETNKMLLRINDSEKTLLKMNEIKETLQDLLFAENISLRISNAFSEISDFDHYISKLIYIIDNFTDSFSEKRRIKIALFDKNEKKMVFKHGKNSSPTTEETTETALSELINGMEFPHEISTGNFPVIYCSNTSEEAKYESMAKIGVKSFAISPVYVNGKYKASLSIEIFDEYFVWREIDKKIISAACAGIAYALMRKEIEIGKSRALMEVKMSDRIKSEFLATISHEVRTPINAIIGLTEIHLQQLSLPPYVAKDVQTVFDNGILLLEMMDKIFDFSKLQQNKLEVMPRDYYLRQIIKDLCNFNIEGIRNKNLEFSVDVDENLPKELFGDDEKIKQVLSNLLSNATKFTEKGSIKLTVKEIERTDKLVHIFFSVKDTGIGISDKNRLNMLSEFSQIDCSCSRKYGGIGIGFSIAREFVNLMGGKIEINSEIGKGSEFSFVIEQKIIDSAPIEKFETDDIFNFEKEANTSKKHEQQIPFMPYGKVLIVDDIKTNLDVTKGLIVPYGLEVDCVTSGKDAIKAIEKKRKIYDLVFMDHMMPDMDGIQTVQHIRKINDAYAQDLPIIALTANITVSKTVFFENGFNDYITKPIDKVDLNNILMKYIYSKQSPETLAEAKKKKMIVYENKISDNSVLEYVKTAKINELDIIMALNYFGNDVETYISVLTSFVNNMLKLMDKIKLVKEDTLPEYAILIHGIKGSCYGIGANVCGNLAKELEITAKKGDFDQVEYKNRYFIQNMSSLISRIDNLLSEIKEIKEKTDNRKEKDKPDAGLLEQLLKATVAYDLETINILVAELDKFRYKKDGDLVAYLKTCVANFTYDKLETKLRERFSGLKNV